MSISISPTLGWKNVYGKCCWKVSKGIAILIGCTFIGLVGTSDETSGLEISSTSLLTYPTRFKPTHVINLIGWSDQTNVGTTIVPIENNFCFMANINPFFCQIFWIRNHNN